MVLVWLATRVLALILLAAAELLVVGDVFYYWRKIGALGQAGLPGTLNEYPTPVVWFLSVPYGLGAGHRNGYLVAFIVIMLALDAAFTFALWRAADRRHDRGVDFWLLYVLLIGPLCYTRFDMLPAVLAGGALLALRRRPWLAGALTGLGAAVKLWPALLIGAFAAPRAGRRPALVGFVVAGFGLAALSLLLGGSRRLFSPLTWQSGRGLQIESVWTTPLLVARLFDPHRWTVGYSRFQAYEIFGPGVSALLTLSTVMTGTGLVVIGVLFVRAFRHPAPGPIALGLLVLATVAVMTISNKTLSPQYLLWMGGPAAALLLVRSTEGPDERRVVARLAGQLLVLALLTHLVYPLLYNGLINRSGPALAVAATLVASLRNLGLLLLTVEVCRFAWQALGPAPRR